MKFNEAVDSVVKAEIVRPSVNPLGVKIYVRNKEIPFQELDNAHKKIIKKVYTFITNKLKSLSSFQPEASPLDIIFDREADDKVTLIPDKPIKIGKNFYKKLVYDYKKNSLIS